jgi:hypothetical protein
MSALDWLHDLYHAATGSRPWPRDVPLLLAPGRVLVVVGPDVVEVTARLLPREDRPPEADFLVVPEAE